MKWKGMDSPGSYVMSKLQMCDLCHFSYKWHVCVSFITLFKHLYFWQQSYKMHFCWNECLCIHATKRDMNLLSALDIVGNLAFKISCHWACSLSCFSFINMNISSCTIVIIQWLHNVILQLVQALSKKFMSILEVIKRNLTIVHLQCVMNLFISKNRTEKSRRNNKTYMLHFTRESCSFIWNCSFHILQHPLLFLLTFIVPLSFLQSMQTTWG